MKRTFFLISTITGLLLGGCGGGGGGGGGSGGVTYDGVSTPAVITEENAPDMAGRALEASDTGDVSEVSGGLFGVVTDTEEQRSSRPLNILIAQTLAETVEHIDFTSKTFTPGVIQSRSGSISCDSGTASYSMTIDDGSGSFSGALNYSNCRSEGVNFSGSLSFNGSVDDVNNPTTFQMSMSCSALAMNDGQATITMNGNMVMTYSGSSITTTMNLVANNSLTEKTVKLENYKVVVTNAGSEAQVTLSGRVYHPQYGYGDITTVSPLLISTGDDWPYAGVFTVAGQNSSLRVDCAGDGPDTYQLQVNTDGVAGYETTTIENWE